VIGVVIAGQLKGMALRARRVVLLPAVLMVLGLVSLAGSHDVRPDDVLCILASTVMAAAIGFGQGAVMHLEARDGALWGRLPPRGLWLWAVLVVSRVVVTVVAVALGAKAASSTDSIILVLGVNRLAQAAVIAARAIAAGVPFAPEHDGKTLFPNVLGQRLRSFQEDAWASSPATVDGVPLNGARCGEIVRRLGERFADVP
jgi:hypothetical protein